MIVTYVSEKIRPINRHMIKPVKPLYAVKTTGVMTLSEVVYQAATLQTPPIIAAPRAEQIPTLLRLVSVPSEPKVAFKYALVAFALASDSNLKNGG